MDLPTPVITLILHTSTLLPRLSSQLTETHTLPAIGILANNNHSYRYVTQTTPHTHIIIDPTPLFDHVRQLIASSRITSTQHELVIATYITTLYWKWLHTDLPYAQLIHNALIYSQTLHTLITQHQYYSYNTLLQLL